METKTVTIDGVSYTFPADATMTEIQNAVGGGQPAPTPPQPSMLRRGANLAMEGVAAFNRPFGNMLDAVLPGTPVSDRIGQPGAYAGDSAVSRAAQVGGELAGFAVPIGAGSKVALNAYKALAASPLARTAEGLAGQTLNFFEQVGKAGLAADAGGSFGFGAGMVAGQELTGSPIGGLVGGVAGGGVAGVAAGGMRVIGNKLLDASQSLLKSATPTKAQLKGASTVLYNLLDDVGVKANGPSIVKFNNFLDDFTRENQIARVGPGAQLNSMINNLRRDAEEGRLTYSLLNQTAQGLRSKSGLDTTGMIGKNLAEDLEQFMFKMETTAEGRAILGGRTIEQVERTARGITQKMKTADAIEAAMEKARTGSLRFDGPGFHNILQRELTKLLQDKKGQGRYLNGYQRNLIENVITGTPGRKTLDALSLVGMNSQDYVKTLLISGIASGVGVGATTGSFNAGAAAALTVTALASAARAHSNRLLKSDALLASRIARAGPDGPGLVKAYLSTVPKEKQRIEDLSNLLIDNRVDLAAIRNSPMARSAFVSDAALFATIGNRIIEEERQEPGRNPDIPRVPQSMR